MGAAEFVFQDLNVDESLLKRQREVALAQKLESRFKEGYDQGYAKGHSEGLEQGKQEILTSLEQNVAAALEILEQRMTDMMLNIEAFYRDVEHIYQAILKSVFEKCVPDIYNNPITAQVLTFLENNRGILEEYPVVTIEVHQDVLESVKEHVLNAAKADIIKKRLEFKAGESLELSDIRIVWHQGGMERLRGAFMQNLETILGVHEAQVQEEPQEAQIQEPVQEQEIKEEEEEEKHE